MREQIVEQLEAHAEHDAAEHFQADGPGAGVQIGERQGQRHHHEDGERIQQLLPEREVVAVGVLLVFLQVADVLVQAADRHVVGRDHQHGQNLRGEFRAHLHRVDVHLLALHQRTQRIVVARGVADGAKDRFRHVRELPEVGSRELSELGQPYAVEVQLRVELIDANVGDGVIRVERADVDEAGDAVAVLIDGVLHPYARSKACRDRTAEGFEADLLRKLFGARGDVLADDERDQHNRETDLQQRAQRLSRGQTRDTEDRELRVPGQLGAHVNGRDQRRDRNDFVHALRREQQHVGQRVLEAIAAPAHVAQFAHQIEEDEQADEREQHEQERQIDLAREIFLIDAHQRAPPDARTALAPLLRRRPNSPRKRTRRT